MDLADDAEGRVAIFTVDATPVDEVPQEPALGGLLSGPGGAGHTPLQYLGAWLDARNAGVAIAVLLAVVLAVGLLFLRR